MTRRMLIGLLSPVTGLFAQDAIGHKTEAQELQELKDLDRCSHVFKPGVLRAVEMVEFGPPIRTRRAVGYIPVERCLRCGLLRSTLCLHDEV